jgi:hypothetical protein
MSLRHDELCIGYPTLQVRELVVGLQHARSGDYGGKAYERGEGACHTIGSFENLIFVRDFMLS